MGDEKQANESTAAYAALPEQIVSKPVVLERGGKPVLVLMPYEEYQRLRRIEKDAEARQETLTPRPRRNTLEKALGLLATGQSAPSDVQVAQWLHEHRMEKYG